MTARVLWSHMQGGYPLLPSLISSPTVKRVDGKLRYQPTVKRERERHRETGYRPTVKREKKQEAGVSTNSETGKRSRREGKTNSETGVERAPESLS